MPVNDRTLVVVNDGDIDLGLGEVDQHGQDAGLQRNVDVDRVRLERVLGQDAEKKIENTLGQSPVVAATRIAAGSSLSPLPLARTRARRGGRGLARARAPAPRPGGPRSVGG